MYHPAKGWVLLSTLLATQPSGASGHGETTASTSPQTGQKWLEYVIASSMTILALVGLVFIVLQVARFIRNLRHRNTLARMFADRDQELRRRIAAIGNCNHRNGKGHGKGKGRGRNAARAAGIAAAGVSASSTGLFPPHGWVTMPNQRENVFDHGLFLYLSLIHI